MALFKKINALVLACGMLAGVIPTASAEQNNVYFYEDFNSYATNESKTTVLVENTFAYVKEYIENDKAIEVNAGISKGKVKINWQGASDNIVMAFDVQCREAKSSISLYAVDSKGNESVLLEFTPKGEIKTYDGKRVGEFSVD